MANYDPILERYINTIITINFTLSTIFLPIIVYLIITKSRQMDKYRFYLLNNVIWCFIFEISVFLIKPTYLFPSTCIILKPLFKIPDYLLKAVFHSILFSLINLGLAIVLSLFYRYSQAFPGPFANFFEKSKKIYILYIFPYLSYYLIFNGPLIFSTIKDEEDTNHQFLIENPTLIDFLNEPKICFVHSSRIKMMFLTMAIIFILWFCLGTTLVFILYYHIKITASSIDATSKMQLMLFRALIVQLLIGYLLILFPSVYVYFLIAFEVEGTGKVCSTVFAIISFHCYFDYWTMLYFIRPYRNALLKVVRLRETNTNVSVFFTHTDSSLALTNIRPQL